MMKRIIAALFAVSALAASPALAQAGDGDRDEVAEQIKQNISANMERLNLTDDQKPLVEAILRDGAKKRQAVMTNYGFTQGDRPTLSRSQMRSLSGELKAISTDTTAKLSRILNGSQMAEYKKIKEEKRAQMRQQIRGR